MILAEWILNKKGLVYYTREEVPLDIPLNKSKINELLLYTFLQGDNSSVKNESKLNYLSQAEIEEFYGELPRIVCWMVSEGETFVILATPDTDEDFLKYHFTTLKEISSSRVETIDLVVAMHDDDLGPIIVNNQSSLTETELLGLSIQGATIVGMGTTMAEGLHGPIPVPSRDDLQTMIYSYYFPAPDSLDSRIREFGRPSFVFLLFPKNYPILHSKNLHLLLEAYLERAKDVELKESRYDML
ncbi:MAG: hypothetical protein ACFFCQ_15990, partial [Promethearchaeota archaeon]